MSYTLNPLKTVRVIDPICDLETQKEYAVLVGGSEVSFKNIISTSSNNNSSTFSCPPPNPGIIVSRKVYLNMDVTIVFTGTKSAGIPHILNGFDAFRAYPLSSIINVLTVTLNNTAVSINMADVIQPLLRYRNNEHNQEFEYGLTPSYMDQFTEYGDPYGANVINGSIRNPLANYFDSNFGSVMQRGGFPIKSIVVDDIANTTTLVATLTEEIYLSPFFFGSGNRAGFIGLQTMDFVFSYVSDLSRIWSHASNSAVSPFSIQSVTLSRNPSLLFKYVTPKELMVGRIPRHLEYDYFTVDRYLTTLTSLGAGAIGPFNSSNIQLNSIPRRMYLLARKQSPTFTDTDTFCSIENISVNWNNRAGLFSGASKEALFDISKKNGCCLSWTQWSGGPTYMLSGAGSASQPYGTVGSVLCIEFGTDIGLQDLESPGLNATYQLQVSGNIKNNSFSAFVPEFVIIIVSEGVFSITDNRCVSQIGVISRQDILDSKTSPMVNYNDVEHVYGSGNFFGDLKRFFNKAGESIVKGVKTVAPYVEKALPYIEKYGPLLLGLGEDEGGVPVGGRTRRKAKRGGVLLGGCEYCDDGCQNCMGSGGKMMSRAELRNRLRN